jgi:chromosome segregation ATPase
LKLFYENERDRLEKRITEEKDRYDRRIAQAIEEYEGKLKEEQGNYEEELENLREEVKILTEEKEKLDKKYQHDLALKQQSIETLEKYVKETKENLMSSQETNSKNLEQHLNSFNNERRILVEKNEGLMNELAKKEKELASLSQLRENMESVVAKKESFIESIRKDVAEERKIFEKKLEELRNT